MKKATLYLYDLIGQGAITAKDFMASIQDLESQGVTRFELHINSYGGEVFDGMAIYNLLKSRNVTTYIDGIAASIASVIALAGKQVTMYNNATLMIHNVKMMQGGDKNAMKQMADQLSVINDQIVNIYCAKTGKAADEISQMMDASTFLSADSALEKGFIDCIEDPAKFQNAKEYVGYYVNVYDDQKNKNKDKKMNKVLLAFMGLAETATEAEITAKLTSLRTDLKLSETATLQDIVDKLKANPPLPLPGGDVKSVQEITDLKTKVTALEADAQTRVNADIEIYVNQAIADCKIIPALKDQFIADAKKDFAAVKADLDKRAKNSALPPKLKLEQGDIDMNDPQKIANAARVYMAEQAKLGLTISYTDAVNAVYKKV